MITPELTYLTWVTVFTALMWMPYILNTIVVRGLINAVGYSENPKPLAPWAARMKQAHSNAIENLVVFGLLIFVAQAAGANNETTALASAIYFYARIVHFVTYSLGVPWVRTLAFAVGFMCQISLALQILM
jgi:uncharacterized MAPEG superfamily protein|tara:strand:+ start:384 stop:776 length:393 start_codon:yes stop_codon:yes gene_type:complete